MSTTREFAPIIITRRLGSVCWLLLCLMKNKLS